MPKHTIGLMLLLPVLAFAQLPGPHDLAKDSANARNSGLFLSATVGYSSGYEQPPFFWINTVGFSAESYGQKFDLGFAVDVVPQDRAGEEIPGITRTVLDRVTSYSIRAGVNHRWDRFWAGATAGPAIVRLTEQKYSWGLVQKLSLFGSRYEMDWADPMEIVQTNLGGSVRGMVGYSSDYLFIGAVEAGYTWSSAWSGAYLGVRTMIVLMTR